MDADCSQESGAAWDPVSRTLLAAITWQLRLDGAPVIGTSLPSTPADRADVARAARRHKVTLPVVEYMSDRGATRKDLHERGLSTSLASIDKAATTIQVHQLLARDGVRAIFIKGVVLAAQTTGRLNSRDSGDIDILVSPEQLFDCVALLAAEGWRTRAGGALLETRGRHRSAHAVTLDRAGKSIDLHHRLDHAATVSRVSHEALWRHRSVIVLGGTRVPTLGPADAAIHIAVNSAQDAWGQLIRVADFIRLLQILDGGDAGLDALIARSREWGAEGQLRVALALARRLQPAIPGQGLRAELLAGQIWRRFARGDNSWRSQRLSDKARVDVIRVLAAGSLSYTGWWATKLVTRPVDNRRELGGRQNT